jgi:hypothetical protein
MTSSSEQDGHRLADPRPPQTSVVAPNPGLSEKPMGGGEARLAQNLDAPTTVSDSNTWSAPQRDALVWGLFIGRTEEIAALRSAIDAALGGQAALVMITGEPGIGKTRLAEEAGAYVRLRGAQVWVGGCYKASRHHHIRHLSRLSANTYRLVLTRPEGGDGRRRIRSRETGP